MSYCLLYVHTTPSCTKCQPPQPPKMQLQIARNFAFEVGCVMSHFAFKPVDTPELGVETHKLRTRFAELQSSTMNENKARTGIDNKLL